MNTPHSSSSIRRDELPTRIEEEWQEAASMWQRTGMHSEEKIKAKRARIDAALTMYTKVLELSVAGKTPSQIAHEIPEVSESMAKRWMQSDVPIPVAGIMYRRPRIKKFQIPRTESEDFAYVLGVYSVSCRSDDRELGFRSRDKEVVEHFSARVNTLWDERSPITVRTDHSTPSYMYRLIAWDLMDYLKSITFENKVIPWEHLGTDGEKKAFFKAVFDHYFSVIPRSQTNPSPVLTTTFTNRPSYTRDFLTLCQMLGLAPRRNLVGLREYVEIAGDHDIGIVRSIGTVSARKADILEQHWTNRITYREYGTEEQYSIVKNLYAGGKNFREISRSTGIDYSQVRAWIVRGAMPPRVKNLLAIQSLTVDSPRPEVITFLCREHQYPSSLAREIARQKSLAEVLEELIVPEVSHSLTDSESKSTDLPPTLAESLEELVIQSRTSPKKRTSLDSSTIEPDLKNSRNLFSLLSRYPLLSVEEERELLIRCHNGDERAREKMVNSNLRLAWWLARRACRNNLDKAEDLFSEGVRGLHSAIEKWDLEKVNSETGEPLRFSTYATHWVRHFILRAMKSESFVHIPAYLLDAWGRIETEAARLQIEEGKVSMSLLASNLGMTEEKIREIEESIRISRTVGSLDAPFTSDENSEGLSSIVAAENNTSQEALRSIIESELITAMRKANLKENEVSVINYRFGLSDGEPRTLEETGMILNLTRERIRQIEIQGLKKLRNCKEFIDYLTL